MNDLLCFLGLHSWAKWSEPEERDAVFRGNLDCVVYTQDRTCARCGETQRRLVRL